MRHLLGAILVLFALVSCTAEPPPAPDVIRDIRDGGPVPTLLEQKASDALDHPAVRTTRSRPDAQRAERDIAEGIHELGRIVLPQIERLAPSSGAHPAEHAMYRAFDGVVAAGLEGSRRVAGTLLQEISHARSGNFRACAHAAQTLSRLVDVALEVNAGRLSADVLTEDLQLVRLELTHCGERLTEEAARAVPGSDITVPLP